MSDPKPGQPAGKFVAEAVLHPSGKGYAARFAIPGMVPAMVESGGAVASYATELAARHVALEAMLHRANNPHVGNHRRDTHRTTAIDRLTPAEFAQHLADMRAAFGVPEGFASVEQFFAHMVGVPPRRVQGWLDGVQDIPYFVTSLFWMMEGLEEPEIDELIRFVGRPV